MATVIRRVDLKVGELIEVDGQRLEVVPMRDGTILRADIYRPAEGGPVPALLVRNPYGEQLGRTLPVIPALEAGFALVNQHCRGRGSSDGEFAPWADEPADGADTVARSAPALPFHPRPRRSPTSRARRPSRRRITTRTWTSSKAAT